MPINLSLAATARCRVKTTMEASSIYRRPHSQHLSARRNLAITDLGMLLVLVIAVFFAMDPFVLHADKDATFKHIHLMLAIPIFALAWIGARIRRERSASKIVVFIFWPLVILAAWIISGSTYARLYDNVTDTFLILGLYMLVALATGRFIAEHRDPTALLNVYLSLLFVAMILGALWQAFGLGVWSKFHEMEAWTIPVAVYFFARAKGVRGRIWSLALMFFLMLLVIKNTSFIVMAIALAYVWLVLVRPRLHAKRASLRLLHYHAIFLAGLAVAAAYAGIKTFSDSALPDGNTEYRFFTYERAWVGFIQSPTWGQSFSGASAELFGLYEVGASTQILPSHSDLLDILTQGGLVGTALFLYGIWRIARFVRRCVKSGSIGALSPALTAHFHWVTASCLCVIPVVAFNPILLQSGKAFLVWMNLGVVIGIAIRCTKYRRASRSHREYSSQGNIRA